MAETHNYLGAGDLMKGKAERPDLAAVYFQRGWERRPESTAVACAVRLAHMYADEEAPTRLLALTGEAATYFEKPGEDVGAEQFFNEIALLANRPNLSEHRDDLRDHALLGLATKLRQRAAMESRPGNMVSMLFGRAGVWPTAAVHDAEYAFRAVFQKPQRETMERPSTRVRLGVGRVTAACHAPATGEVFVGFLSGDVVCFRPATGEVVPVKVGDGLHVVSLATAAHGEVLTVLQSGTELRLRCYTRLPDRSFRMLDHTEENFPEGEAWLTPLLAGSDYSFGLWVGGELQIRHVVSNQRSVYRFGSEEIDATLLLPSVTQSEVRLGLLFFLGRSAYYDTSFLNPSFEERPALSYADVGWTPSSPPNSSLLAPTLAVLPHGNDLELAGLDSEGVLNWSRLHFHADRLEVVARSTAAREPGFLAATTVRPSLVAAVAGNRIEWLRGGAPQLTLQAQTAVGIPQAIACFASAPTSELLVIGKDGILERIAVPF
jgi:hypothetical protein